MAGSIYLALPPAGKLGPSYQNGSDGLALWANSSTEAQALARAFGAPGGGLGTIWNVTPVTTPPTTSVDLRGWTIAVTFAGVVVGTVTYIGVTGDSLASFLTNTAAAINNAGLGITHAAYVTGTLTTSGTGDSVGNATVTVALTPPANNQAVPPGTWPSDLTPGLQYTPLFVTTGPYAYSFAQSAVIGSVTSAGASSAATSVAITSAWATPGIIADFKQKTPAAASYSPGVTIIN